MFDACSMCFQIIQMRPWFSLICAVGREGQFQVGGNHLDLVCKEVYKARVLQFGKVKYNPRSLS